MILAKTPSRSDKAVEIHVARRTRSHDAFHRFWSFEDHCAFRHWLGLKRKLKIAATVTEFSSLQLTFWDV